MPCAAAVRGKADLVYPWDDTVNNDPCGRRIISTANGVNLAAHSLCLFHLMMKLGANDVRPPYVDAA